MSVVQFRPEPPFAIFLRKLAMKSVCSTVKVVSTGVALAFLLAGCSTLDSAYKSTVGTVSEWLKSDDAKDQKK